MAQTRLKQLREEAVLTVHELAETSGVSDDTISKIENGQRVARPSTLRKLAHALDVSPQELRRPAKVEEPVPLGKAPREAGRPDEGPTARDIARTEARRLYEIDLEAIERTRSSGSIDPAIEISDAYDPAVYDRLSRHPPEELAGALLDAERENLGLVHKNGIQSLQLEQRERDNRLLRLENTELKAAAEQAPDYTLRYDEQVAEQAQDTADQAAEQAQDVAGEAVKQAFPKTSRTADS